jgi:hypothetical protein
VGAKKWRSFVSKNDKSCSDQEFLTLFQTHGAAETARILNVNIRNVYDRRKRLEKNLGLLIQNPNNKNETVSEYQKRIPLEIENGCVIIGSDAHYWPKVVTTAHRAFVHFCKALKPKAVILNGDVQDGARISRHPSIGWERKPTVLEEIETIDERLDEIRKAALNAELFWTIGNHDLRFESRLSQQVGEFEGMRGMRLCDHFPHWLFAMSIWINDHVVVKHRFRGGIHATTQNPLWSGKSIVTGHLHSLQFRPLSDYNGTRYGIDTGTLADPHGPQFTYIEDNPVNWRSGFVVLTFHNKKLLCPELVIVHDENHVEFRGQVIKL